MVAIVPIRSRSKRIKDKNIKLFNGKPLFYWCLHELNASSIERIIISTDSQYYIERIKEFNFDKVECSLRSEKNATDTATSEDVLIEVIEKFDLKEDIFFCQITTPFLSVEDIDKAIEFYKNYDSVISVVEQNRFLWDESGTPTNYDLQNRSRSQDFESYYVENGSFYINSSSNILRDTCRLSGEIGLFKMNTFSYFEIDDLEDWKICEILHQHYFNNTSSFKQTK